MGKEKTPALWGAGLILAKRLTSSPSVAGRFEIVQDRRTRVERHPRVPRRPWVVAGAGPAALGADNHIPPTAAKIFLTFALQSAIPFLHYPPFPPPTIKA